MKRKNKILYIAVAMSFLLTGCGAKDKISIKVGNELSSSYEIVDGDKLDINKSMYYSVDGLKKDKETLTVEIKNIKENGNVLREDIKLNKNDKAIRFDVKQNGKYKVIVKDNKNKVLSEKEFNIVGNKIENPNKKLQIKKQESKEVKVYNNIIDKVEVAKATKIKEVVNDAKNSVKVMKDSDKKASLKKELDEIKVQTNISKNIKAKYKMVLGIDVVEADLKYNSNFRVFVDDKEVKCYKTSKNTIRFSGKKSSLIYITNGKEVYKVVF